MLLWDKGSRTPLVDDPEDELGATDVRTRFTVKTVPRRLMRLGDDPWRDYTRIQQRITEKMRKSLGSQYRAAGAGYPTRTDDLSLTRRLLYQLS